MSRFMPRFTTRATPTILVASLLVALLPAPPAAQRAGETGPFSRATPASVGMSQDRLRAAADAVRDWIARDRIVGAVMLVIRHDRVVLFEAAGWADRENKRPMTVDAICSMRSMTKPLVGTAALMLMEEGRIGMLDRVSQHLAAFDTPASREITITQLLTHTSGITGDIYDPFAGTKYTTLTEAVEDVARKGPAHKPGTRYVYSDPGTSTLGAVISKVAGVPAEDFVQARILTPLKMDDSFLDFRPGNPRAPRVPATYRGSTGKWERYWDTSRPEVVPFFRASGGLYASAIDYAKFMAMTLNGGEFRGRRLLALESVRLATSPQSRYVYPPQEAVKRQSFYGLHWTVQGGEEGRVKPGREKGSAASPLTRAFWHGGSDGTLAWADPATGVIGVYLTQSRGSGTGSEFRRLVQAAIDR
jgi:CubicO group peptidase (beta-lactamase class C family)